MEERTDGYDPVHAFEQRRQIYLAVQDVQRLEHDAVKRIADMTMRKKRELLEVLSTWLLNQTSESSNQREAEFLSGCSLRSWLDLQTASVTLQSDVDRCKNENVVAEQEYKNAAPFGCVSEWTAESERKTHLKQLAATWNLKIANQDMANKRLDTNIVARQEFAKKFLRGCLGNAEHLSKTTVFGERARVLVSELASIIAKEWGSHTKSNMIAITQLESNIQQLKQIYRMEGNQSG